MHGICFFAMPVARDRVAYPPVRRQRAQRARCSARLTLDPIHLVGMVNPLGWPATRTLNSFRGLLPSGRRANQVQREPAGTPA